MSETRAVADPFLCKNVQVSDRLVDRLRGRYACGPTMPNGEPEFGWSKHEVGAIQHEAAEKIEHLTAALTEAREVLEMLDHPTGEGNCLSVRRQGKSIERIIDDALNFKRSAP